SGRSPGLRRGGLVRSRQALFQSFVLPGVVIEKHGLQIRCPFECDIAVLRSPAIGHIEGRARSEPAPMCQDLLLLLHTWQSILTAAVIPPFSAAKSLRDRYDRRARHAR